MNSFDSVDKENRGAMPIGKQFGKPMTTWVSNEEKSAQPAPLQSTQPKAGEDKAADIDQSTRDLKTVKSFDDLNLKTALLRGIYSIGWERPSYIQERAILPCLGGGDVIGQAQSGKGKTGCFVIAALQTIDESNPNLQVLIMAPTRELASQIHNRVLVEIGQYMDISSVCMIGGTHRGQMMARLREGVQVAVGTPGRVIDMLVNRQCLDAKHLKMLVLDEADEMLGERGFQDQVYEVFGVVPKDIQVCLFSATLPKEVLHVCHTFMRHPTKILVKAQELTLDGLKQYYIAVEDDGMKIDTLLDLYQTFNINQAIIFANRKRTVEMLYEVLNQNDFTCSALHGQMSENGAENQRERTRVLNEFRTGKSRILITTDLLARGFDANVSLVINYDMPTDRSNYLHRIGRSARYGRKGVSINMVNTRNQRDLYMHDELQRHYATTIDELPQDVPELS